MSPVSRQLDNDILALSVTELYLDAYVVVVIVLDLSRDDVPAGRDVQQL